MIVYAVLLYCRFRGTYCGQDVAIKVLKPERLNENLQREFAQEVYIMRYLFFQPIFHFLNRILHILALF